MRRTRADHATARTALHRFLPLLMAAVAGCGTVAPVPLDAPQRDRIARESRERLFAGQEPIAGPLTLYEASARAIRYQADVRARMMEQAAALGQLDVAQFDLLPKLTVNAGYSTRNNDAFGFGFTPGGAIATNPTASVERSHATASLGFTWSVLDFGVSYYRARQLADQSLIAGEHRRKALQNLLQDVRLAWWRAEAAQRLLPMIETLFEEVEETVEKTRVIEERKLLPPLQTASLRRALLDLEQQISARRQELRQSQLELAALVNAPPGTDVRVAEAPHPPVSSLELSARLDALDELALRNRPEVAEEFYKARINAAEAKKAMLGLFPNLSFDLTRSYDSNRFLLNNNWTSTALSVAFNLVRAFSADTLDRSAEAQRKLDEARLLAMAMSVMTQTRIAAVRFGLLEHEFGVWDEATRDDERIVKFLSASAQVGIDNELELIRAKARFLASRINRDLVYANLEAALGRVYNSVGMDVLPEAVQSHETGELARHLQTRLEEWQRANFSSRQPVQRLYAAVGQVRGVPEAYAAAFRKAVDEVLQTSGVLARAREESRLQIVAGVVVEPLRSGGRPVLVRVSLVDAANGAVQHSSEFRTTLSEPLDAEQWRAVGEAVAYQVLGPINRINAGRPLTARQRAL